MKCPYCLEETLPNSTVCQTCKTPLKGPKSPSEQKRAKKEAEYNKVVDQVGLLPNLKKSDNLFQGITVLVFVIIGALLGLFLLKGSNGLIVGALGGLIVGGFLSGLVLMILGYTRK